MRTFFIHSILALSLVASPVVQAAETAPLPAAVAEAPHAFAFSEIEQAIHDELVARGMDSELELQQLYVQPTGNARGMPLAKARSLGITYQLALADLKIDEQSARFVAMLEKASPVEMVPEDGTAPLASSPVQLEVRGRYVETVEVPALNRKLRKGDVIASSDIEWVRVPKARVRGSTITQEDKLVGRTPRRLIEGGEPVRVSDIESPRMVERGKPIAIFYRTGAMELRDMGVAMSDGAAGDIIQVKNMRSNLVVQAMVSAPNTATVNYWQHASNQ